MKQFGFPQMMMGGDGGGGGGGGESESDYEDAYAEALSDYGPAGHTDFSSQSYDIPGFNSDNYADPGQLGAHAYENQDFGYGLDQAVDASFADRGTPAWGPAQGPGDQTDPGGPGPGPGFGVDVVGWGQYNSIDQALDEQQSSTHAAVGQGPRGTSDLSWALAPGPLDQPPSDWFASLGLLSNTPGSPWGSPTSITVNAQPHSLGDQTDPGGSGPGPGIGPSGTPTSSSPVSGPVAGFAPEASPFGVGYTPSPESWAADGSFDPYGSGLYGNSLQNPDVQALIKNSPLTAQSYAYSQKYGWLPPEIAAAYQSQFGAPKEEGPSGNRARASAFLGQTGFMPYWYDELPRVASLMDAYNARDYLSNIPAAAPRAASAPSFAGAPMTAAPPMTFDLPSQGQLQVGPTPPGMDQQQFIQSMYSQFQAPPGTQAPSPNHYFDGNQWQEATASTLPSWMQYNQA
jgi:hypothetical protein